MTLTTLAIPIILGLQTREKDCYWIRKSDTGVASKTLSNVTSFVSNTYQILLRNCLKSLGYPSTTWMVLFPFIAFEISGR